MQELIVFAHGMANFSHLRVKKKDQETLIRKHLGRHSFCGAFDDSGNLAFLTPHGPRCAAVFQKSLRRHNPALMARGKTQENHVSHYH
jgi:hypothetical protein